MFYVTPSRNIVIVETTKVNGSCDDFCNSAEKWEINNQEEEWVSGALLF